METFRNIYEAEAVIIATGGKPRLTGAVNEEKFLYGKGISFCATCDAAANKDKTVMIVGNGDSAIEEGIFLTKFAKKVIVSVTRDTGNMRCHPAARKAALKNEKMETNIKGVYCAGDVRDKPLRQVSTAVGNGAVAGYCAEKYISENKN